MRPNLALTYRSVSPMLELCRADAHADSMLVSCDSISTTYALALAEAWLATHFGPWEPCLSCKFSFRPEHGFAYRSIQSAFDIEDMAPKSDAGDLCKGNESAYTGCKAL